MSAPLLQVENATRRFGGLVAVNDVSMRVAEGELVSIIGPNGAGKTTLFNLLTGQLAPSSGRVLFAGEDISRLPPHKRARRGLGRTFQVSKTLTSLTALENVMVGAFMRHAGLRAAAQQAARVLEMVGMGARADTRAAALSLSERRRLEVARALALEPRIVLLDEVMAGLNTVEIDEVLHLITDLNARGFTFLVIEHNLKVVRALSQRVIVLDQGSMIAEGTATEVLEDQRVIEAYIGRRRA